MNARTEQLAKIAKEYNEKKEIEKQQASAMKFKLKDVPLFLKFAVQIICEKATRKY